MFRTRIVLALALILPLALRAPTASAADAPPAAKWVSQNALVVLELSDPGAALDLILSPDVMEGVKRWAPYQAWAAQPDAVQLQMMVKGLEQQFKTDWPSAMRKLLGGGVTLAVMPGDLTVMIVDTQDAQLLAGLHEVFLAIARGEAAKQGLSNAFAPSVYRGTSCWSFGPNEAHAIVGNRLLIANGPAGLHGALDLLAEPGAGDLASEPAYRQAVEAAGADATFRLYVNTKVLKYIPKIQQGLADRSNPLVSLLFAGVTEALQDSSWLAMGLTVDRQTLKLTATTDGTIGSTGVASFALPAKAGQATMPNLTVPRQIAGMSLYRDLPQFYTAKDKLFPERTSGLIFFENMMGIFFTGRDLTGEILAQLGPNTRLVVAEQDYAAIGGTPVTQVPAFAAIFELEDPEHFAMVAEEAWQKALGMVNFTRGQNALPGLIIRNADHGGTTYSVAAFTPEEDTGEAAHARYNFRPSLAVADNYLILSSTDGLAEDLIDAVKKGSAAQPQAGTHSLLRMDGPQLASILNANREAMVLKNMVEKGHTRDQAENEFDMLVGVVAHITQAELAVRTDDARSTASLTLGLDIPGAN